MWISTLKARLAYCSQTESKIKHAKGKQLQLIKEKLSDEMGLPVGFHTMGLPLALSMLGIILSFSIPQFAIWSAIFSWFQLPEHAVLVAVFATALVFAGINAVIVFMVGKGFMAAIRAHLVLAIATLIIACIYFLTALLSYSDDASWSDVNLPSSIVSLVLIMASFFIIHSRVFYLMLVYSLHNRAFRKVMSESVAKTKTFPK